ncbi:MAG: AAA family ATPase, partial [Candidatus Dormibacteraeota bacterium]|nr:AAA family ATPase [Candidatus Dormibacteraeota bacterium]
MITQAVCRILVGRDQELSSLEDALLAACRGQGSVIVLAGDAGMGKSRLCAELATRAERIGATVMEGSCSEADLALPYLPFLEAIGNHLSTAASEDLRKRLGVHIRELAKVFPQLAQDGPAEKETDSPESRLRLFEAILALLGVASEDRGLLLIVEDLHWADASTRELLDYMTRRLRNRSLLVLATYRRDEMHRKHPLLPTIQGWQRSRLAQLVELEPLAPEGVARMVSSIFDNTDVGAEFRDFIHARSEGNPFVLEEMLKAAIDRGDIYRDGGDWQRKPIAELRIPGTVRDTILMRVERLDPGQAEILRCAAVLGRSFDYQTLIRLSDQSRVAVETALQTAVQQQLLEEEAGSKHRYRFRHALTQEAIYEDLSAPTRERLHSAAADVLAQRMETPKAEVAFHLRNANRWQEAIQVTMEAAAAAEARLGYGEAAALYSLLLPVVTTGIDRARLLCLLGEAYWLMGTTGRAVEPLEEGIRLLELAGQPLEAASHRLTLGRCYWEGSNPGRARAEYEKALQTLEPAGPSRDLALAYIRLSGLHVFNLEAGPARELAEKAISTAAAANADDMRIWALNFLGLARSDDDYLVAIELLEQSAREALERGLYNIAGNALHNVFGLYIDVMDMQKLRGLISRLEAIKVERWGTLSRLFITQVYSHQTGDVASALKAGEELDAQAHAMGDSNVQRLARRGFSLNYLELARYDEAREHLVRPSSEMEAQDAHGEAWIWMRFHLASGDLPRALEGAEFLLSQPRPATLDDGAVAAVEAFLAAGRLEDAQRMLAELEPLRQPLYRQAANVARALIALFNGDTAQARPAIEEAVMAFKTAGMAIRELNARLQLAEIHLRDDDASAAEGEFRIVLEAGRRRGLVRLARKAEEGLAGLGIVVDAPMPELTGSVLAPAELGERLVTVMFADVRGYTAMVDRQAPSETVDLIATYQRW